MIVAFCSPVSPNCKLSYVASVVRNLLSLTSYVLISLSHLAGLLGDLCRLLLVNVLPGRGPRVKRPYEDGLGVYSAQESSYVGSGKHKKQRLEPSSPKDEHNAVLTVLDDSDFTALDSSESTHLDDSALASPPVLPGSILAVPTHQDESQFEYLQQQAGPSSSEASCTASPVLAHREPVDTVTTRAYDARFAYPAVCICAEHPAARHAVHLLVAAVRDSAAVLTRLHAEHPVEHRCSLLGRIFDFDGFLS